MAADGVIVPGDGLIGLLVGHTSIHYDNKLWIRETRIPQFGKTRARQHNLAFCAMVRHVKDDVIRQARQPHSCGFTCKRRQLIQPDKLHDRAFLHSGAKQLCNGVALRKCTLPRARQAHQLDATLFAHSSPAGDQNLLHLVVIDLVFVKLFDIIWMHSSSIEGTHIGLAQFVAAWQQKQRAAQDKRRWNPQPNGCRVTCRLHKFILVPGGAAGALLCLENQRSRLKEQ
jgi:hypothetical protein